MKDVAKFDKAMNWPSRDPGATHQDSDDSNEIQVETKALECVVFVISGLCGTMTIRSLNSQLL